MGKDNKGNHLSSPYISPTTVECWHKIQEKFGFQDSAIETTVQNYGSTVSLICNYCQKDFLELTEKDADAFFSYLDRRITDEEKRLSPRTVHTYKKNLNSVGEHFEAVLQKEDEPGITFLNPFRKKIGKTDAVKEAEREYKLLKQRCSVKRADVLNLLKSVKQHENIQYFLILSMISFCGLESHAVCEMKPLQLYLEEDCSPVLYFYTPMKRMMQKTKKLKYVTEEPERVNFDHALHEREKSKTASVDREQSVDQDWMTRIAGMKHKNREEISAVFREYQYQENALPQGYNEEFAAYYMKNKSRIQEREFVFYNRNHNPVNFKSISSVLKKHKEILSITYPLTTKELCGSCKDIQ